MNKRFRNITLPRNLLAVAAGMLLAVSASTPAHANVKAKYDASCATCHQAGVLGAPKTGDKAAWNALQKKGMNTLLKHVKDGYNNMPARGLCDDCSDSDYTALINMMKTGK